MKCIYFILLFAIIFTLLFLLLSRNSHYSPLDNYIEATIQRSQDSTREANDTRRFLDSIHARNTIITKAVDERGLISVVYTNGPDTFALDYITQSEFDSLTSK